MRNVVWIGEVHSSVNRNQNAYHQLTSVPTDATTGVLDSSTLLGGRTEHPS